MGVTVEQLDGSGDLRLAHIQFLRDARGDEHVAADRRRDGAQQRVPEDEQVRLQRLRERNGDFSQSFDSNGNLIIIHNPFTRQPFEGNRIPAGLIDPVGQAIVNLLQLQPDERIQALLRFESTKTEAGGRTSLQDYVGRMKDGQEAIYYLLGSHRDTAIRNPNLEYFRKHDLEVLLLTDPVDAFVVPGLDAFEGKPLKSIEKADLDLKPDEDVQQDALAADATGRLIERFKTTLGDRVEDVVASKRLVDSAATLVVGKEGLEAPMERMMKLMNEDFKGARKVLEVNPAHPLLKNLARLQEAGGGDEFSEGGEAEVYFTDDDRRMIVQLKTKLPVGTLNLVLRSVGHLRAGLPITTALLISALIAGASKLLDREPPNAAPHPATNTSASDIATQSTCFHGADT